MPFINPILPIVAPLLWLATPLALWAQDYRRFDGPDGGTHAVLLADGSLLTSGDDRVRLWDTRHDVSQRIVHRYDYAPHALAALSQTVVTQSGSGQIELRDLATGQQRWTTKATPDSLCVAPAAKLLSLIKQGEGVAIYSTADEQAPRQLVALPDSSDIMHGILAQDGSWYVGLDKERHLAQWQLAKDLAATAPKRVNLSGHADQIRIGAVTGVANLATDRAGKWLVLAGSDTEHGMVDLWKTETWSYLRSIQVFDEGYVSQVALSPDGSLLAASGNGVSAKHFDVFVPREDRFLIKVYDTSSFQLVGTLRGHREGVYSLAFSADGKSLVSGSADNSAIVWNVTPAALARARTAPVAALEYRRFDSPHGDVGQVLFWCQSLVMFGSHTAWEWDVDGQRPRVLARLKDWTGALAVLPSNRAVASGRGWGQVEIRDLQTGSVLWTTEADTHLVSCSPVSKRLCLRRPEEAIDIWDIAKEEAPRRVVALPDSERIHKGVMVHDGSWFAGLDGDGKLWRWKLDEKIAEKAPPRLRIGDEQQYLAGGLMEVETAILFADRAGKYLLLGGQGLDKRGVMEVWDARAWRLLKTVPVFDEGTVSVAAFSPDGKWLAVAGDHCRRAEDLSRAQRFAIMLYDTTTFQVVKKLSGHREQVTSLMFSDDGKLLASGGGDNLAIVWKVP